MITEDKGMGDALVEIIGGLILAILSGLGFYTRKAHNRIDDMEAALAKSVKDLDREKANLEDIKEMKADIKYIRNFIVEISRWQGQMEGRGLNTPDKS